tara:strand:- start:90 stop:344 length:255 start_codon:yes stop_codon:yes gene_type:complete
MFILTDKSSGGVHAILNAERQKTVQVFEQEDDAIRYVTHLEAQDYPDELEIMEIDTDIVAMNCDNYGYSYAIVGANELLIPTDP